MSTNLHYAKVQADPLRSLSPEATHAAVDEYYTTIFPHTDPALASTAKRQNDEGIPNISVTPNQGKFLQILVRMAIEGRKSGGRVIEVGTLAGYSTIWLSRPLKKNGGKLVSLELNERHAKVSQENISKAGLDGAAQVWQGRGEDGLKKLISGAEGWKGETDIIFIDADKESSAIYSELALELIRPGGIIVVDNTVRKGAIIEAEHPDPRIQGIRKMNDVIAELIKAGKVTATTIQTVGEKGYDGFTILMAAPELLEE